MAGGMVGEVVQGRRDGRRTPDMDRRRAVRTLSIAEYGTRILYGVTVNYGT